MSATKALILILLIILNLGLSLGITDCGHCISDLEELNQRQVLIDIYESTNGAEGWLKKSDWNSTQWNCSYCYWYGIVCDSRCMVKDIVLPDNHLNGTLPNTLWKLSYLEVLDLNSNRNLRGNLENVISKNMTKLQKIDLSFCSLEGTIPEEITLLKNLKELRLCGQRGTNKLNGTIPKGIGHLKKLVTLRLGENNITGPLPRGISGLKKLTNLDLENIAINSTFDIFRNLSSLRSLNLSKTGLWGELPSDLGQLFPNMTELLLPGNNLKGSIPHSIGRMKYLKRLSLANNKLSGAIPGNITLRSKLSFLDISANNLSSIENASSLISHHLEILLLSDNRNLSVEFSQFLNYSNSTTAMLNVLIIKNCSFYGKIPKSLWSFWNLIYLDVGNNKLEGSLPEVLTPMYTLLQLDVSHNRLEGPIPSTLSRIESLHYLNIRGNKMTACSESDAMERCEATLSQHGIQIDGYVMYKEDNHFRCPGALLKVTKGRVNLDPKYYGYTFCRCERGFYGQGKRCRRCMEGGRCVDNHNMTIRKGYWPEPNPGNVTRLTLCNHDGHFFRDKRFKSSCNPGGNCNCSLETLSTTKCKNECLCGEGSFDRLCSRCYKRWYKSGNICYKCPSHHHTTYMFIVVLLATLFIFVMTLIYLKNRPRLGLLVIYVQLTILLFLRCFNVIPGWVFEVNAIILLFYLAGMGNSTKGLQKIFVFYLQILDAMVSTYKLWPKTILKSQQYISSLINFHFPGLMCDIPDLYTPIGQFKTLILLPVACIVTNWLFYTLLWIANRFGLRRWNISSIKYHCLQITITCLNLTYFPIGLRSIAVLSSCKDGEYMRIAPWIRCRGPSSNALNVLAWLATFVYVIGVPLFIFLPLLLRYVKANKRSTLTTQQKETMDKWLGSIYLPYKEKFRSFYEVYALLRKLLLAFMIGYIPEVSSLQTFFVSLVLAIALIFHLAWQPYQSSLGWIPIENILETVVLVVLQHSFILLRFTTVEKSDNRVHLLWIIVTVNCMVVLFLIVIMSVLLAKRAVKSLKNRSKTEICETKKLTDDCVSYFKSMESKNSIFKPLLERKNQKDN